MTQYATPGNLSGFYNLSQYANTVTDNYFWVIMLFVIGIVAFFVVYRRDGANPSYGITGAGFAMTMVSTFLQILGLVAGKWFLLSVLLLGAGMIAMMLSRDNPF